MMFSGLRGTGFKSRPCFQVSFLVVLSLSMRIPGLVLPSNRYICFSTMYLDSFVFGCVLCVQQWFEVAM
jgi:hypothetical protein